MNSVYVINNIVGVESEESADFTTQWYQTVGVSIVLVQFGDIVSPHFYKVLQFVAMYVMICRCISTIARVKLAKKQNGIHLLR